MGKLGGGPPFFDSTLAIVGETRPVTFKGKWNKVANSSVFKIAHSFFRLGNSVVNRKI